MLGSVKYLQGVSSALNFRQSQWRGRKVQGQNLTEWTLHKVWEAAAVPNSEVSTEELLLTFLLEMGRYVEGDHIFISKKTYFWKD